MLATHEAQKLLNAKRQNSTIEFKDEYNGDKVSHLFLCKKCDYEWLTTPNILKRTDNVGCPNCHKANMILKKQHRDFSKVRGATKLLKNLTLSKHEVSQPIDKKEQLSKLHKDIDDVRTHMKSIENSLPILKNSHTQHLNNLNTMLATKARFGFLFGLLLFPIWLWYQFKFDEKANPYIDKEKTALSELNSHESKYKSFEWDIKSLESNIEQVKYKIKYETNLLRLQNRINIHLGGKTRLYYFRFRYNEKVYYKIGITINSVYRRYVNADGSMYGRIEKIFFDTNIKEAKRIEDLILHTFNNELAKDKTLLGTKGGYSEVFLSDVLNLDT